MTDPIAEGVKLVPELREGLDDAREYDREVSFSKNTIETIIAALTAAGELVGSARIAEARKEALEEAYSLAFEYPARAHGCLASEPGQAAEQAGKEIAAAIRALAETRE